MPFRNSRRFVKIKGEQAALLRDRFVVELAAKEGDDSLEKALALKKAKRYAILVELQEGTLKLQITIDSDEEPYVAFGPNFVKRLLADSAPLINLRGRESDYEYAGAGA